MKTYTNVKQSKNLLNLGLKPESADMCYIKYCTSDNPEWRFDDESHPMVLGDTPLSEISVPTLPCWSLAALLGVLPFIDFTMPQLIGTSKTLYVCKYNDDLKSHPYDNGVDACYNLILKLNQQNLI